MDTSGGILIVHSPVDQPFFPTEVAMDMIRVNRITPFDAVEDVPMWPRTSGFTEDDEFVFSQPVNHINPAVRESTCHISRINYWPSIHLLLSMDWFKGTS